MVLFILSALLFLRALFFKPRADILCCGIWGGSFNIPLQDDFLIKKLQVLAMFNQERGEDSVGYYNGVSLIKDADKNKKVLDFVLNLGFEKSDQTVFIGHNRKQSRGAANLENAHPFNIDDKLILAHNGTLENWTTLADKHGISHEGVYNDSRIFGALLAKVGPEILEQYKGYAAIAVHRMDEPGSLYLYHGASREITNGDIREERPLFYMKTKEGVFFSSILRSLEFIKCEGDSNPEILPHNIVFTVRDGVFSKKKIKVSRENMNVTTYPINSYYQGWGRHHDWDYNRNSDIINRAASCNTNRQYGHGSSAVRTPGVTNTTNSHVGRTSTFLDNAQICNEPEGFDIRQEFVPSFTYAADSKNKIFYHKNRYYIEKPDGMASARLCNGQVLIDRHGTYHPSIPPNAEDLKIRVYYFYNGIMIETKKAYDTVIEAVITHPDNDLGRKLTRPSMNFAKYISKFSRYPVANLKGEAETCNVNKELFFLNEEPANGNNGGEIKPLFSDRTYTYKNGILRMIKSDRKNDNIFFPASGKGEAAGEKGKSSREPEDGYEWQGSILVRKATTTKEGEADQPAAFTGNQYAFEHLLDDGFKAVRTLFHRKYDDLHQVDEIFGASLAYCALYLYMQDVAKQRLNFSGKEPKNEFVQQLIEEFYDRVVTEDKTPSEIMDKDFPEESHYIAKVLSDTMQDEVPQPTLFKNDLKIVVNNEKDATHRVPLIGDLGYRSLNAILRAEDAASEAEEEEELMREADEIDEEDNNKIIDHLFEKIPKGVQDLEEHLNKIGNEIDTQLEEATQDDEAVSMIEDVVADLNNIEIIAQGLGDLQLSKFADKLKQNISDWVTNVRKELITICKAYKYNDLADKVRDSVFANGSDID